MVGHILDPDASTSSPKKGQGNNQPGENLRASEFTSTETEQTKHVDTNNVPVPNSKRGRDIEAFGFIPNKHNIDSRVAMERDGIV